MLAMPWLMAAAVSAQSGGSPAEPAYREGLAALHSLSTRTPTRPSSGASADPGFPLAYWGEALTYHQSLWGHEDIAAGRRALARLAARAQPNQADARTRGLVGAAAVLFGEGDGPSRRVFAEAMATPRQHRGRPGRRLALRARRAGTTTRSLAGTAGSHDEHSPSLAGSPEQAQAGEIGGVLAAYPRHPAHCTTCSTPTTIPPTPAWAWTPPGFTRRSRRSRATPCTCPRTPSAARTWAEAAALDRASFLASEAWVELTRPGAGDAQLSLAGLAAVPVAATRAGQRRRGPPRRDRSRWRGDREI